MGSVQCSPCPETVVSSDHQTVSSCHTSQCDPSRDPGMVGSRVPRCLFYLPSFVPRFSLGSSWR